MIEHFLTNPFRNSKLGDKRFLKYATVHAERVRAATGLSAAVLARLVPTDAGVGAYRQLVERNAQTGAKRKGQTGANNKAIARFQKYVGQQALILEALFTDLDQGVRGRETAQYLQFFPQGVTAVTEANKAQLDTAAAVFLKAAQEQQAQVGAAVAQKAQELWQAVLDSRRAQLQSLGSESDGRGQRGDARQALADELFLNLLVLLVEHHTDPAAVLGFFPEAILKEYTGLKRDAAEAEPSGGAKP